MDTSKYLRNFGQQEVKNNPINNPVLVPLNKLIKIEKSAEEFKRSAVKIKKSQEKYMDRVLKVLSEPEV